MLAEDRYDSLFKWYGLREVIDWRLLKAQVKAESAFNPKAHSPVGAEGLAQFMPATFAEWSRKLQLRHPDANDPEDSIACQAAYMRWLLDKLERDTERALAAYNFGIGHELRHDQWPQETQDYVVRVLAYYQQYQEKGNV